MRLTQALSWLNGERAEVLSHYDPTLKEEEPKDEQMELWKEQEDDQDI